MIIKKSRNETRNKRHLRIRKNLSGTSTLPRLNVYRSNMHIYAQVIDDVAGVTLVSASSIDKEFKDLNLANGSNIEAAKAVGTLVAKRALEKNIEVCNLEVIVNNVGSVEDFLNLENENISD